MFLLHAKENKRVWILITLALQQQYGVKSKSFKHYLIFSTKVIKIWISVVKCCLSPLSHPINATAEVLGLLRSFVWIANKIPRFITGCKRVLISSKALINMDIKCIHHLHNNAIPSSQFRVSSGPPGFCKGLGTPSHPLFQAPAKHERGIMRTKRSRRCIFYQSYQFLTSPARRPSRCPCIDGWPGGGGDEPADDDGAMTGGERGGGESAVSWNGS